MGGSGSSPHPSLIPALPFCRIRLQAKKADPRYPKKLGTFGDHLRKRRLELGLLQREVAERVGADKSSVNAWELNYHQPALHLYPAVVAFLGYDPAAVTDDVRLGRRVAVRRRASGFSQRALAERLGIDEGTVGTWERGNRQKVSPRVQRLLTQWLSRQK